MYPASIQFTNDCFHQKTYPEEYIAEGFSVNTIAVTGWPRYDKIAEPAKRSNDSQCLSNLRHRCLYDIEVYGA